MIEVHPILTGGEIDTLVKIVEQGPVDDGGLPSKVGRNGLLKLKFIAEVVVDRQYWHYAATPLGLNWYLTHFNAPNINDAITNRISGD